MEDLERQEHIFVSMVVKAGFERGYLMPSGYAKEPLGGLAERIGEVGLAARAGFKRIWGSSAGSSAPPSSPQPKAYSPPEESEGFDPGYEGYTEMDDAHTIPPPWKKDQWPDVSPATGIASWGHEKVGFGKHKKDSWLEAPEGYLEWMVEKMGPPKDRRYMGETRDRVAKAKAALIKRATGPGREETPF